MAKSKCRLPETFDGNSSATRFFKRYELCCTLNAWTTHEDKVGQLFPLLSDKVFDFVSALPDTDKNNYDNLKKRVLAEYENLELEQTYADQFSALKLKPGEDLGNLMAELKHLVVKAYPDFSEADKAKMVMNQFLKSLSAGARSHIMLKPKLESTFAACDEMLKDARLVHQIERTPSCAVGSRVALVQAESSNPQLDKVLTAVEDLTKMMAEISTPLVSRVQEAPRSARNRTSQFRGKCFKCGETGHMARSCGKAESVRCKVCGNKGHEDRDCMMNRRQQDTCKLCGNPGHVAGDCAMRGKRWPLNY